MGKSLLNPRLCCDFEVIYSETSRASHYSIYLFTPVILYPAITVGISNGLLALQHWAIPDIVPLSPVVC